MKDIDFDELDRAVSSVLGTVAQSNEQKQEETKPHVDTASSVKPLQTSGATTPDDSVKVVSSTEQAKPSSAVSIKRRGKFMDVMHPSSTMVASKPATMQPALPDHAASTIEPLSEDVTPDPVPVPAESEMPQENSPVAEVKHPSEPTAELDESHVKIGAEPEPVETIDLTLEKPHSHSVADESNTNTQNESSNEPLSDNPTSDEEQIATLPEAVEAPTTLASNVSQLTPFLSDTKVDKRPLGGFGDGESGYGESPTADGANQSDAQATPVVPLPRELQADVVNIEAAQEATSDATTAQPTPFTAGVAVAPEVVKDDGRVEGHPLFDTSTYHEPIAAAHENSFPGWAKWLLGLLVCLALGAGVGYFLFSAGL